MAGPGSAVTFDSLDDALKAVAAVAPVAREHAAAAEHERKLPAPVVEAIGAAGLWGVFTPKSLGGSGLGRLGEQFEIVRAMTYADGSAGWTLFIAGGTPPLVAARLPADGRAEVFAEGPIPMAGVFMPGGQAREVDGGLLVNGRWAFGSGIQCSPWVMANAIVVDDNGAPLPSPYGPVDIRSVVVRRDEVALIDDWHVAGLRGTGSVSFSMEDVVVPNHRTFAFLGPVEIDDAPYRLPLFTFVAGVFAGIPMGLAERVVDEVTALLPTRVPPPTFEPASQKSTVQLTLGRAIAAVRAARESTAALFGRYDARIANGEDLAALSIAERAEIHSHVVWVAETCTAAVNELFPLAGASAVYETGIIQRCWRDIGITGQHLYLASAFHEYAAQAALGLEVTAFNV